MHATPGNQWNNAARNPNLAMAAAAGSVETWAACIPPPGGSLPRLAVAGHHLAGCRLLLRGCARMCIQVEGGGVHRLGWGGLALLACLQQTATVDKRHAVLPQAPSPCRSNSGCRSNRRAD